jgi:chromosomal replication initiation ATPase DnaA
MELTASELWQRILDSARAGMPEQSFRTWLSGTRAVALSATDLEVEAPSEFHVEWIEDKFRPVLAELTEGIVGRRLTLTFRCGEAGPHPFPDLQLAPPTSADRPTPAGSPATHPRPPLNER